MKKLNKILLASLAVALFSCDNDFENPVEDFQVTSGEADFEKYIALGNSLTSGYTDNALFRSAQENSYPNMLAGLMKAAGGGEFKTPWMQDDIGGFTTYGMAGKLQLQIVNGALTPVPTPATGAYDNVTAGGPYQNAGVPGAKSYHLMAPGYGNPAGIPTGQSNPYFARFSESPTQTVLEYAAKQDPTFFSLWIGNNDVLGYAISGGVGVDQAGNVNPATYGSSDISDVNVVKNSINAVLNTLVTGKGAKGVIANIPSVTSVPYFTTVPYAPLSPTNESFGPMIPTLNATFAGLNQVFDALGASDRKIVFSQTGASPVVIKDKDLPNLQAQMTAALTPSLGAAKAALYGMIYGQARQATAKDLLVLTSSSYIGKVDTARVGQLMQLGLSQAEAGQLAIAGITYPLEDQWVLSEKEVAKAEAAVVKYNNAILELSRAYDIAIVDTYSEMKKLSSQTGIRYYGNTYTTTFVSGGAFSLDGIHLTGTGYALVANMFVDAINLKYKSNLRKVFPGNYPGVKIP